MFLNRPNFRTGGGDSERARLKRGDDILFFVDEPARDDWNADALVERGDHLWQQPRQNLDKVRLALGNLLLKAIERA